MFGNYLLLSIFSLSTFFFSGTVAHEAIIGGFPVHGNSLPTQVSVQIYGRGHVCGGGIIDDRLILTAAHCLLNRTRHLRSTYIYVLAGTSNLNRTGPPAVTVRVEKVFFPSEFHPMVEFKQGDIAFLKLKDSLQLTHRTNLQKLKLPWNDALDTTSVMAGFGWNQYRLTDNVGIGSTDGQLRYSVPEILPNDECARAYPGGAIQSDTHLCTGIEPRSRYRYGVCNGDEGGPLVDHERTVIGILSRIPPHCDERFKPATYTRVANYLGMILNIMHRSRDPNTISLRT